MRGFFFLVLSVVAVSTSTLANENPALNPTERSVFRYQTSGLEFGVILEPYRFNEAGVVDFGLRFDPSLLGGAQDLLLLGTEKFRLDKGSIETTSTMKFTEMEGEVIELRVAIPSGKEKQVIKILISRQDGQVFFYPERASYEGKSVLAEIGWECVVGLEGMLHESLNHARQYRGKWNLEKNLDGIAEWIKRQ